MTNFDLIKVPIFEGVNDVPRVPMAGLAGNGSDLIDRFNQLVDAIESLSTGTGTSAPSETWGNYTEFYVNTISGNDVNDGLNSGAATKTLQRVINVIATKKIYYVIVNVTGVVTEQINISALVNSEPGIFNGDKNALIISGLGSNRFGWHYTGEIIKGARNPELRLFFNNCDFIAQEGSIVFKDFNSPLRFSYCSFDSGANNYGSNLILSNNNYVDLNDWNGQDMFKNSGGNCWANLEIHNQKNFVDLVGDWKFKGTDYPLNIYQNSNVQLNLFDIHPFDEAVTDINIYLDETSKLSINDFSFFVPEKTDNSGGLIIFNDHLISRKSISLFVPSVNNESITLIPWVINPIYIESLSWGCANPLALTMQLYRRDVNEGSSGAIVSCDDGTLTEIGDYKQLFFPQTLANPTHLIPTDSILYLGVTGTTTNLNLQLNYWE